jgi:hypothetical protein
MAVAAQARSSGDDHSATSVTRSTDDRRSSEVRQGPAAASQEHSDDHDRDDSDDHDRSSRVGRDDSRDDSHAKDDGRDHHGDHSNDDHGDED